MDDVIRQACREAVEAQYAGGASRVALRGPTGSGLSTVVINLVAAKAREGSVLIVAPAVTHGQIRADLAKAAPDLEVGEFEAGTPIEIVTSIRAAIHRDRRPVDAFSFVVAEECWPNEAQRLREVVDRFDSAEVLEVVRMPEPHATKLDCDAMVDLEEVMALQASPSP